MADGLDKGGDSEHASDSSTSRETSRSSSFFSEASKKYSKQAKRRKKWKHAEDWWDDTCDTIETRKRKKNQVTKHKIVRKKRKTKKRRKSRKGTERLPKRRAREQDVIFTALVRIDKNDSRIPVLFSLTWSCAASFAACKGKVLEACGLSRKNVQLFYLHKDLKVQLSETTWAAFMHFLKGRTDYTVSLELETVSSKVSASIQSKEPGKRFLAATLSSKFPRESKFKQFSVEKDS